MQSWDIKETCELIEARYGHVQVASVRDSCRSLTIRFAHASYHFAEIKRLLGENIDAKLPDSNIYELTFPGTDKWSELQRGLLYVEAHMIACAQAIHAVPDALSHVAYYAAGLNLPKHRLAEHRIGLKNLLSSSLLSRTAFASVHSSLTQLREDDAFKTLDALVNYGKHRGLPDPVLEVEPEEKSGPYAMHFPSFMHNDVPYVRMEVETLLAPAYEAVNTAVVRTGHLILDALRGKCGQTNR